MTPYTRWIAGLHLGRVLPARFAHGENIWPRPAPRPASNSEARKRKQEQTNQEDQ